MNAGLCETRLDVTKYMIESWANGEAQLLDIVISHPIAQSEPRVADTPGFAVHVAALNLYYNNFAIPAGHMVPHRFLSCRCRCRLQWTFVSWAHGL